MLKALNIEHRSNEPLPGQASIKDSSTVFMAINFATLALIVFTLRWARARISEQSVLAAVCKESNSWISFRENPTSCDCRMKMNSLNRGIRVMAKSSSFWFHRLFYQSDAFINPDRFNTDICLFCGSANGHGAHHQYPVIRNGITQS